VDTKEQDKEDKTGKEIISSTLDFTIANQYN
jgi:hypothetical protein